MSHLGVSTHSDAALPVLPLRFGTHDLQMRVFGEDGPGRKSINRLCKGLAEPRAPSRTRGSGTKNERFHRLRWINLNAHEAFIHGEEDRKSHAHAGPGSNQLGFFFRENE